MFGRKDEQKDHFASAQGPREDPKGPRPYPGTGAGSEPRPASNAGPAVKTATRPVPAPVMRRPIPAQPSSPSPSRIGDIPGMLPPRSEMRSYGVENKTLVVGREISLSGQIAACDKLVVEGTVEAEIDHCRQLEVAPTGLFQGAAEIDEAEIAGRFEGRLTVLKRLRVRSSGRIHGTISYAQIEIDAGGQIAGDVTVIAPAVPEKKPVPPRERSDSDTPQ